MSLGMRTPKFDEVKPYSSDDETCFRELREVLLKHDAIDRFGVCLLHEHFPMDDEEMLLETVDEQARTMTISPARMTGEESGVLETIWRFSPYADMGSPTQKCIQGCKWETNPTTGKKEHNATHKRG